MKAPEFLWWRKFWSFRRYRLNETCAGRAALIEANDMPILSSGLVELIFSFSVPLIWAIWELRKLRREQAKDAEKAAARERDSE